MRGRTLFGHPSVYAKERRGGEKKKKAKPVKASPAGNESRGETRTGETLMKGLPNEQPSHGGGDVKKGGANTTPPPGGVLSHGGRKGNESFGTTYGEGGIVKGGPGGKIREGKLTQGPPRGRNEKHDVHEKRLLNNTTELEN